MAGAENKTQQNKREGDRKYTRTLFWHRVRRWIVRILAVLVIAAVVYQGWMFFRERTWHSMEMTRTADHMTADGASLVNLGDTIVEYNSEGAVCMDMAGRTIWEQSFEMEHPMASIAGNVIAFADYNGRNVYVMDSTGLRGNFVTSMDVRSLTAAANGDVLCIMDGQESDWIRIYTADGQERAYFVRNMGESGYPLTAVLSPDGSQICISNLLMDGTEVHTVLSFYDLKKGDPEQNYLVSSYEYQDEIVPMLRFIDSRTCIALSDARLMFWDLSGDTPALGVNSMFSEEVQSVFTGDGRAALVFMDETANEMYRMDIYDSSGNKLSSIPFSLNYSDVQLTGRRVYINNSRNCMIFREDGAQLFNGSFDKTVLILHPPVHGRNMNALTGKELDEIELR